MDEKMYVYVYGDVEIITNVPENEKEPVPTEAELERKRLIKRAREYGGQEEYKWKLEESLKAKDCLNIFTA